MDEVFESGLLVLLGKIDRVSFKIMDGVVTLALMFWLRVDDELVGKEILKAGVSVAFVILGGIDKLEFDTFKSGRVVVVFWLTDDVAFVDKESFIKVVCVVFTNIGNVSLEELNGDTFGGEIAAVC